MKRVILLVASAIFSLSLLAQIPKLKLTTDGVKPIVVEVKNFNASQIYQKTLEWVQETYKNPNEVLKANIKDKKIRIDGFAKNAWFYKSLSTMFYDMTYTVEVSFKDGRYRFEYIINQFYANGDKVFYNYTAFFKNNGEVKKIYRDAVPSLESTMNNLSNSLYEYINGTADENDDW